SRPGPIRTAPRRMARHAGRLPPEPTPLVPRPEPIQRSGEQTTARPAALAPAAVASTAVKTGGRFKAINRFKTVHEFSPATVLAATAGNSMQGVPIVPTSAAANSEM